MLKNRILATLKFFDLQEYPLTLLELHKFLIQEVDLIKKQIDSQGEVGNLKDVSKNNFTIEQVLDCLDRECINEVQNYLGFYFLLGRKNLVLNRLNSYSYGIEREKIIKRYIRLVKYIPFIRGVALGGSQAMGLQKENSDIDLLIITDPEFMWLGRTLITAYFQILGKRRHGEKIKNRFCLNHYLAGAKELKEYKNLYTAYEYLRLRTLVTPHSIWQFKKANSNWLNFFLPECRILEPKNIKQTKIQYWFEQILNNKFGLFLENLLKNWQLPKIRKEKFIVVEEDELSFHPDSKQQKLLLDFFKA